MMEKTRAPFMRMFTMLVMLVSVTSIDASASSGTSSDGWGKRFQTTDATPESTEARSGDLVISKFVCTQIEEPTATISLPVGADAAGASIMEKGCVADSAEFQIFASGDFTSEPIDVFVNGTATVNSVPSTEGSEPNALFEPAFNVYFSFDVAPGGVTTIAVLNPAGDGDGATPADDGDDAIPVADSNDGSAEDDADAASENAEGSVSALPSTGQGGGVGANGAEIVLLFGTMGMVALAGGFAWRQRRTS